jgi:hypothetical protein
LFLGLFCIKHTSYQPAPERAHSQHLPGPTIELFPDPINGYQGAVSPLSSQVHLRQC